ncbi:NAD(+) synthase [Ruminococcus sp. AM46-18]|jgi:NAD+ synthase|nr:NAD(+) synthase [Ruminococcus sp. AM46-18]
MFNVEKATNDCIQWIRDWREENGPGCNFIVGISGGVDSLVAAELCVEAIGADNVLGVIMPNFEQRDIKVAYDICQYVLGIDYLTINIGTAFDNLVNQIDLAMEVSNQTLVNLPARLRMATLYAVSQSHNGRVVNTCNLSEDWVGYSTRYGDAAGDFSPLAQFTKGEVKAIGHYLGLPKEYVEKTPSDGLCGKSDEENLGFTYEVLDKYIRTSVCDDPEAKRKIDRLHKKNEFKMKPMPYFNYKEDNYMTCCSPEDIAIALEKAQETINRRHTLYKELRSCERQIKDGLGVDVYIAPKDEFDKQVYKTLSKEDVSFVGRTKDIATGKIRTTVGFKDGTQTSVVLNEWEDEDDTEKAIMWCLLKKCFKSKRSLERVIYSMEDM